MDAGRRTLSRTSSSQRNRWVETKAKPPMLILDPPFKDNIHARFVTFSDDLSVKSLETDEKWEFTKFQPQKPEAAPSFSPVFRGKQATTVARGQSSLLLERSRVPRAALDDLTAEIVSTLKASLRFLRSLWMPGPKI